jgi:nucleolar protein 6
LHDERARDAVKEVELANKKEARKLKKEKLQQKKDGVVPAAEKKEEKVVVEEKVDEAESFGMNPARLAMMSKPAMPTHRQRY